jgi:hypothetical protein
MQLGVIPRISRRKVVERQWGRSTRDQKISRFLGSMLSCEACAPQQVAAKDVTSQSPGAPGGLCLSPASTARFRRPREPSSAWRSLNNRRSSRRVSQGSERDGPIPPNTIARQQLTVIVIAMSANEIRRARTSYQRSARGGPIGRSTRRTSLRRSIDVPLTQTQFDKAFLSWSWCLR